MLTNKSINHACTTQDGIIPPRRSRQSFQLFSSMFDGGVCSSRLLCDFESCFMDVEHDPKNPEKTEKIRKQRDPVIMVKETYKLYCFYYVELDQS